MTTMEGNQSPRLVQGGKDKEKPMSRQRRRGAAALKQAAQTLAEREAAERMSRQLEKDLAVMQAEVDRALRYYEGELARVRRDR
jgi:regulator of protease activity HflC (stomatin/prohibitin superfamily)